jgi:toxin ParE1/3/4
MPLRLHEEAGAEYLEAVRWYRPRSPVAARRFRAAVGAAIALVRENPERWGLVPRVPQQFAIRRVLVKDFPYSVVYMVHDTEVVVLAIAHGRRRPGYWRSRLRPTP